VVGSGSHRVSYTEEIQTGEQVLEPAFFIPALCIIKIPTECPEDVGEQIRTACSLFWSSPAASGNRIRSAIEALLTEQGIARSSPKSQKGKKLKHLRRLGLHERIERYSKRRPALAEQLHAIKWVGHEASHSDELTKDDVLDALEIIEHVLDDLYAGNSARRKNIVAQINRRRKPRSKRRKAPRASF
jgi:hypothetical protein